METEALKQALNQIGQRSTDAAFLASLPERKRKELEFHNLHRDEALMQTHAQDTYELMYGNKKFYTTVELSLNYIDGWLKDHVEGKIFLDYACGNGRYVVQAAQHGAELAIGLDISDVSVENGRKAAKAAGVGKRCSFVQGDCEATGLPDESVDVILCSGMLHHLDLSYAFPELRRILKPGGKILAVEALDYNPVIKLYRTLTPTMRTDWEKNHILSMKDIEFASRFFDIGEVKFWHLLSPLGAYVRAKQSVQRPMLRVLNGLDSLLLKVPGLRLMSWQFTFELIKPVEQ